MRRLLLVLTLAALAAGCSARDRANPLDPANPDTRGRPTGFASVAGYTLVMLSWTPQPSLAIDGFQIERLLAGDSLYRPLGGVLPPSASGFLDSGEPNGVLVRYRLYYVIHGAPANLPAEDQATPGPLLPWVVEQGGASVTRLSPDGRHVMFRVGDVGHPQSLAIAPAAGAIWSSSIEDGLVSLSDNGGTVRQSIRGLASPSTMAANPADGSVWVCDPGGSTGQVWHFGTDGGAGVPASLSPLDDPEGIALSPRDHSVWVCERAGNRLSRYAPTGVRLSETPLAGPTRVLVDSLTGVGWVSSFGAGRIWRLSASGALLDSSSVTPTPIGMAVDYAHGRAWVVDPNAATVYALDPSTLTPLFSVGGLSGAWDVAVDRATGDAWVTVRGQGEVVRLAAADGRVLERCGGLDDPIEVRLDPGQ